MTEDPVLASDGVTYERHSIESWFQNRMTKGVCVLFRLAYLEQ